jgi:hypothetical protein
MKIKLNRYSLVTIANCIPDTLLFDVVEEDTFVWYNDIMADIVSKVGYKLMQNITRKGGTLTVQEEWNWLWKVHAPPKAKHFGVFVKVVYQPGSDSKKGVSLSLWYVLFVSIVMRMIGMF